jgi:hypothetical protein
MILLWPLVTVIGGSDEVMHMHECVHLFVLTGIASSHSASLPRTYTTRLTYPPTPPISLTPTMKFTTVQVNLIAGLIFGYVSLWLVSLICFNEWVYH